MTVREWFRGMNPDPESPITFRKQIEDVMAGTYHHVRCGYIVWVLDLKAYEAWKADQLSHWRFIEGITK